MHSFHSDKVLANQGYSTLPLGRSKWKMAARPELPNPQGQFEGDLK